jgi:uncharacterized protein YbjT (DUF2867 family)
MILITGSTGQNGGEIARRLSARGIPVRALVRDRTKAEALAKLPHVEIAVGDMASPDSLAAALRGVDRAMLISSATPTMLEAQSSFIDAAAKAGVRHVVKLSGIAPDLDSPFRFARMHALIEQKLERSGMNYTNLRPGEFMPSYFRQAKNIVEKGALCLPMGDAKIASIDVGDVADVAVLTLTNAGHEGKNYSLTGSEALTMAEVAAQLSNVAGKTVRYIDVPPDQAHAAWLAAGFPPFLADGLRELFAERRRGSEANVYGSVAELLGRPPTRFIDFAQRNAATFRGETRG